MTDCKEPGAVVVVGALRVDTVARTVTINGVCVHFGNKEFLIIELLVRRRGEIFTKAELHEHLYGTQPDPDVKIIEVFICRMRKMLAFHSDGHQYIKTIWGQGYTLGVPTDEGL